MANALIPLFEHNLWANLQLLEACGVLTEEQIALTIDGVYGTPATTFVHYLSGEQRYIFRLTGEERQAPLRTGDPWPGVETLADHARWSGLKLQGLAESVAAKQTIRQHFDDADWDIDGEVVLVQAINHSTEHRAHIVTTLSARGIALPEIDGWNWAEATGRMRQAGG